MAAGGERSACVGVRWRESPPLAIGVGGFIQRPDRAQHGAAAGVDQIDPAQIPTRIAQLHLAQVAEGRGNLKALAFQAHGAVGAALGARHLDAECGREFGRARARAVDIGAGQVAGQRGGAQLGMQCAVVFLFNPGLGSLIEQIEGERCLAFEHRHQAPLDSAPERLLLGVLIRRIRQRRLVQDAQGRQAVDGFLRQHRRTVVGHQGARRIGH